MRILKLTARVQKQLVARRSQSDGEAQRAAAEIVADVRKRGDRAVFDWTAKLDHLTLNKNTLWISEKEIRSGAREASLEFMRAMRQAARNIRRVAERQLPRPWSLEVERGVRIQQRVEPIESIGCYIPGGQASLVSTMLMTVIPAQVAGVPRIVAVCPRPNAELMAAAEFLGIREFARVGGAQAIAVLAYGTRCVARVEKIFGPGNKYVTAAKQLVSTDCAIDLPAGPTEAIVLADRGNARWIAADLLAQAEHAEDAGSFLVTTSPELAAAVQQELRWQLAESPRGAANISTAKVGAILVAKSMQHACEFVSRFAPEHLSLPDTSTAKEFLRRIRSSGTIFLGGWAAQPLGDYVTGSNHVLPTGGWARRRGGLSTADFVNCLTVQTVTRKGFLRLAGAAEALAEAEHLLAHRNAVRIRR